MGAGVPLAAVCVTCPLRSVVSANLVELQADNNTKAVAEIKAIERLDMYKLEVEINFDFKAQRLDTI